MRRITGLVYDEQYLRHAPGEWHPERPARLEAIMQRLQDTGLLEEVFLIRPYPAPLPWIERLHDPGVHQALRGGLPERAFHFRGPGLRHLPRIL